MIPLELAYEVIPPYLVAFAAVWWASNLASEISADSASPWFWRGLSFVLIFVAVGQLAAGAVAVLDSIEAMDALAAEIAAATRQGLLATAATSIIFVVIAWLWLPMELARRARSSMVLEFVDPIFHRKKPILFAHRGGAKEAPESTSMAFSFALETGADILELDVEVTRDGVPIVWHGRLDPERISGLPAGRWRANELDWEQIARASVRHPSPDVSRDVERLRVLRLEQFLVEFPDAPLNIELEGSVQRRHLDQIAELIDRHRNGREILLACNVDHCLLRSLRNRIDRRLPTNLPALPLAWIWLCAMLGLGERDLRGRAAQIPHARFFANRRFVDYVIRSGGSVHVFLTAFFGVRDLEKSDDAALKKRLRALVELGVHGIMTDQPHRVGKLLREVRAGALPA